MPGSLSLGLLELSNVRLLEKPGALQSNLSARAEALFPQVPPQVSSEPPPRPTLYESSVPLPDASLTEDDSHGAGAETSADLQASVQSQKAELNELKLQESLLAQQAEIEELKRQLAGA